jgi:hypothetical protein
VTYEDDGATENVSLDDIKPHSAPVSVDDLRPGDHIMVNFNFQAPDEPGFCYEAIVRRRPYKFELNTAFLAKIGADPRGGRKSNRRSGAAADDAANDEEVEAPADNAPKKKLTKHEAKLLEHRNIYDKFVSYCAKQDKELPILVSLLDPRFADKGSYEIPRSRDFFRFARFKFDVPAEEDAGYGSGSIGTPVQTDCKPRPLFFIQKIILFLIDASLWS